MFTSFSLVKSYNIPEVDKKALLWFLEKYSQTDAGLWMKLLPWRALDYKYCYAMKDGIMGAWLSVTSNTIYLAPEYMEQNPLEYFASPIMRNRHATHPTSLSNWAGLIAPVAVHELRHKYQRKCMGKIGYTLCTLPILRQFTLEKDAVETAKSVGDFFDGYMTAIAMNEFESRLSMNNVDEEKKE